MKKVISLLLAILVAFTFAASSFAADDYYGNFVDSPELEYEGSVISAWYTPGESLEILFTPFVNRDILARDLRIKIEQAYSELLETDITTLVASLDKTYNGIFTNLAVSKFFDLSEEYGAWAGKAKTITIGGFDLSRFVCLLHFGHDGWEIVKNATIVGLNLVFSIDNLSPFAVIVAPESEADAPASPATGDIFTAVSVAAAIALGCGAVYFISKSRKKAEDLI